MCLTSCGMEGRMFRWESRGPRFARPRQTNQLLDFVRRQRRPRVRKSCLRAMGDWRSFAGQKIIPPQTLVLKSGPWRSTNPVRHGKPWKFLPPQHMQRRKTASDAVMSARVAWLGEIAARTAKKLGSDQMNKFSRNRRHCRRPPEWVITTQAQCSPSGHNARMDDARAV